MQRQYFANKGLSSQGYGFSIGHVWMWELDCEESWALKNWCFWTVVLENTLESLMDCSTPGLPVHHQLLEFTQTHVHWISDAIQPPRPVLSPSPPAFNLSQHQSFPMSQLFAWGGQSIGVSALASALSKNTQDRSPFQRTGWISLQSKGLLRVFSNTTVQKHQFFGAQLSLWSSSHIHTWPLENHSLD